MFAWQFAKMLHTAAANGWTRFVSMQNHLNPLYREEQREMLPLCRAEKVRIIPWSPLARGRLTREWAEETRDQRRISARHLYDRTAEADRRVIKGVAEVVAERGVSRAHLALAWLLARPEVTAPVVGVTRLQHLEDALRALDPALSESDKQIKRLEAPYVPHAAVGFS